MISEQKRVGCEPFAARAAGLQTRFNALVERQNMVDAEWDNGVFNRYVDAVLTARHVPLEWRYDFDENRNPFLMERLGVNAVFNAGAINFDGKSLLVARVEGFDRKSFFAIAESETGIDRFRFRDEPVAFDENDKAETNWYDMRLTCHEDGWIYGTFCVEKKDPDAPESDTSSAVASCGIVRTRDMKGWDRLPDLVTPSTQQRNVVLHPEFVSGKYLLYTRPMDSYHLFEIIRPLSFGRSVCLIV